MDIAISEIFYSIQGEGFYSGKAAIFVRLAGCNLSCNFCDTDFSLQRRLSAEEILQEISEYPCAFVVLTGGEPTVQKEAAWGLVKLLQAHDYYVAMETNGTKNETLGVDWVTVSPKLSQQGKWLLKQGDELKLVYEDQDLSFYENSQFTHYLLQPKEIRSKPWGKGVRLEYETKQQWQKTFKAVQQNPLWRLSFQIHKELEVQ